MTANAYQVSEPASSGTILPTPAALALPSRRVLHVGCGHRSPTKLHSIFRDRGWREVRLDVNKDVRPDIVGSFHAMDGVVLSESFDAVWSSHSIEHLHVHEVAPAFAEFARVLRPGGFVLIRCPDLEAVARALIENGPDHVCYVSPAGPITPLDMLFGHGRSVAAGNPFMRHSTGFTVKSLGRLLLEAGFTDVYARVVDYDLWAVAFLPDAEQGPILGCLAAAGLPLDV